MEIVKVSEVDYAKGQIKVEMPAKDNIVSSWITLPNNEYEMPEVGDLVRVEFEPARYGNAYVSGICYGKYFNRDTLPKLQGKDIFYKEMLGDVTLIYDRAKKQLTIQTDKEIILKAVEKLEIQTKQLIINAEQVEVTAQTVQVAGTTIAMTGQTSITGETSITGNLSVSGIVSAANI